MSCSWNDLWAGGQSQNSLVGPLAEPTCPHWAALATQSPSPGRGFAMRQLCEAEEVPDRACASGAPQKHSTDGLCPISAPSLSPVPAHTEPRQVSHAVSRV